MPTLARLAARGEVGRAAVIPPGLPPGSDVGNMSILGYDPARYHTGRAPIEAAALGLRLRPDQVAYRCNLSTVSVERHDARLRRRPPDHRGGDRPSSTRSTRSSDGARAPTSSSTPACSTATSSSPRPTGPRPTAPRPTTSPTSRRCGPPARRPPSSRRSWTPAARSSATSASQANQVWLWGQGFQPQMPRFVDQTGCQAALVTAVDLIRGLGVLTDIERVEVPGRHGLVRHRLRGQARRRPAVAGRRRRPVPHPRRGHRRGRPRRQPRREDQGAGGVGSADPRRPRGRARCDGAVADAPAARPPDARRAEDAHHRLGALPAGRLGGRRSRRHLHRSRRPPTARRSPATTSWPASSADPPSTRPATDRALCGLDLVAGVPAADRSTRPATRRALLGSILSQAASASAARGGRDRGRRRGRRRRGRGCSRRCARRTPAGRRASSGAVPAARVAAAGSTR